MTKKQLEKENKFLWYYFQEIHNETQFVETTQYNKKGEVIARSSTIYPKKKFRPKLKQSN